MRKITSLPAAKLVHDKTNGYWLLLVETFPGVYETAGVITEDELQATYGYRKAD